LLKILQNPQKRKEKSTFFFNIVVCSWLKYHPSYLVWVSLHEEESSRDKIDQMKKKWKMKTRTQTLVNKIVDSQWNQM
jgi:hypothetical protein